MGSEVAEASPDLAAEVAMVPSIEDRLPLHFASYAASAESVRLLLGAGP